MRYSAEVLDAYRQKGDPLADEVILKLIEDPAIKSQIQQVTTNKELAVWQAPEWMQGLLKEISRDTNDPALIEGQQFFEEHLLSIMALLGLYSLPYCYAAANGAKVLIHSKNIIDNPGQRLGETAQFVLEVCRKGAFDEEGSGLVSILKVRLMHAAIRYHAKRHITFETPINQEDLAGTNLSFSLLIIRGLRKLGKVLDDREVGSYLQMWNTIGSKLGIESFLLPETNQAFYQLEKGIRKHQFRRSEEGDRLTQALLNYFDKGQDKVAGFSPAVAMAVLMGDEVAACINVSSSSVKQSVALSLMRSSQFFLNFIDDHYRWVKQSIEKQMDRHAYEELFLIPV